MYIPPEGRNGFDILCEAEEQGDGILEQRDHCRAGVGLNPSVAVENPGGCWLARARLTCRILRCTVKLALCATRMHSFTVWLSHY